MVEYCQRVAQGCRKVDTVGTIIIRTELEIVISIQLQLVESCIPLDPDQTTNFQGKIVDCLLD